MTTILIQTPVTGFGPALFMAAPAGAWRVVARLTSTADIAVLGPAPGVSLTVAAAVTGDVAAVSLGQSPLMQLNARLTVTSAGRLTGDAAALVVSGQGTWVTNDGTIRADGTAVVLGAQGSGEGRVVNRGEISGATAIARHAATDSETLRVENAGRITGTTLAFDAGSAWARDVVVNTGQIIGGVRLGPGDDLYDTRGGRTSGLIDGGPGDDVFRPGPGVDRINGGSGTDWLWAAGPNAALVVALDGSFAGVGATLGDIITGIEGLRGSDGAGDRLAGRAGAETLLGLRGDDQLFGRGGADLLDGGLGDDTLDGGDGADTLMPGAGDDVVRGGTGVDLLSYARLTGAVTVDLTTGRATGVGSDTLSGIEGVEGSVFGDRLTGNGLANLLIGQRGFDTLEGGAGADTLLGGDGNDRLTGGAGADVLWGGAGADRFILDAGAAEADVIGDWGAGDLIVLTGTGLAAGALDPAAYRASTSGLAADGGDRVLFRLSDTTLWFDADGTGALAPRMLADLQAGAVLAAGDLLLA